MMNVSGMYCLGRHGEHARLGTVEGVADDDRYLVRFDEMVCPTCGPQRPEAQAVVAIADMKAWLFFDTPGQRDAFNEALLRRDAGLPYDNSLTARAL